MTSMPDVQSTPDVRNIPINQVGIKDLRFPIRIRSQSGEQATVARISMTVSLPAEQKGTHMSRFVALMEEHRAALDFATLEALTRNMLARLEASAGKISIAFPFFRQKAAPVSGEMREHAFIGSLKIVIPVTSLCPCSKEISDYGAHNQRSHVTLTLRCREAVAIEEAIDCVENQASCQLYGLLKRPDEKFVTEHAYENPKFVEDMVRDIATVLKQDPRIAAFTVESENFESIHNHSAYALVAFP